MSDIEGKVTRVGATKRGQRRSFKSESIATSSPPRDQRSDVRWENGVVSKLGRVLFPDTGGLDLRTAINLSPMPDGQGDESCFAASRTYK